MEKKSNEKNMHYIRDEFLLSKQKKSLNEMQKSIIKRQKNTCTPMGITVFLQ